MYDIVIIGGGPGGYAAALYAYNFGLSVALVERDTVGGTCLLRGCIPAKSWLASAEVFSTVRQAGQFGVVTSEPRFEWPAALERKNKIVNGLVRGVSGLLKKREAAVFKGHGRLTGPGRVQVEGPDGTQVLTGRTVILATGSTPAQLPGFEFDGQQIVSSDHALDWPQRPERVGIVGAGIVGCEFASLLVDVGSQVVVFEMMDQILPGFDPDVAGELQKRLQGRGARFVLGASSQVEKHSDRLVLRGGEQEAEVDVVLVAVGRRPLTSDVGLETTTVTLENGYVVVNLETMETGEQGVYAVGDIVAQTPGLAHGAFAEAIAAVTHIATGVPAPVNYQAMPSVVYTHPEVASVGVGETKAAELGIMVNVNRGGFAGVGRAQIIGQNQGLVKVLSEENGPIVGAAVVGPQAGEMIHELMYAVGWEALPEEAARFVHAHPTLSEAVGEVLLGAAGHPLH